MSFSCARGAVSIAFMSNPFQIEYRCDGKPHLCIFTGLLLRRSKGFPLICPVNWLNLIPPKRKPGSAGQQQTKPEEVTRRTSSISLPREEQEDQNIDGTVKIECGQLSRACRRPLP